MELISLKAKNLLCYKNLTLNLNNKKLSLLTGDTGAGKSSIFDIITYALYDRTVKGIKLEDLPNWYLDETGEAELTFKADDNQTYIITKKVTKNGNCTTRIKNKHLRTAKWTNTQHKNKIKELVNIDFETFLNSIYITQGKLTKLVVGTDSERNKILSKFLDIPIIERARKLHAYDYKEKLEQLNRLEESIKYNSIKLGDISIYNLKIKLRKIKENIKKVKDSINRTKKDSEDTREEIEEAEEKGIDFFKVKTELNNTTNRILENQKTINELKNQIETDEASIQNLLNRISITSDNIVNLENQIETEENKKSFLPEKEEKINSIKKEIKRTEEIIAEKINIQSSTNTGIENTQKYIEELKELTVCHFCKTELSESKREILIENCTNILEKLIDQYENETKALNLYNLYKSKYLKEIEKTQKEVESIKLQYKTTELILELKEVKLKRKTIERDIDFLRKNINSSASKIKIIDESNIILKQERSKLTNKIDKLSETYNENILKTLRNRHYILMSDVEKKHNILNKLLNTKSKILWKLREAKELSRLLDEYGSSIKNLEKTIKYHKIYSIILSKAGFRVHKIEAMLQTINSYIDKYQGHFGESKIKGAEFTVTDENKIDLLVWIDGLAEPKSIKCISGGEKEIISFPTIVSVFSYIFSRNYSNVMFIDEGLIFLDEEKKSHVSDILKELKEQDINIFIISHDNIIKDFDYDNILQIENNGKFSSVKVTEKK